MSNSLQVGSKGPTVATLQGKLNSALMLVPNLATDGSFGAKTATAVKTFQQRKGLAVDGVVGPKTAGALGMSLGGGPAPTPGGGGGAPPPGGTPGTTPGTTPGGPPASFVDLSVFSVVVEAIISGFQRICGALLDWIDSDYVPQFVYDQAAGGINGVMNGMASQLRGTAKGVVSLGQNPSAHLTQRVRDIVFPKVSALSNLLNPLVGLPVIGGSARGYQMALNGILSVLDSALIGLRNDGQSAQATASRIYAALEGIARRIS